MNAENGPRKRKIRRWVGLLCVIAAVLGGIDLALDPSPLDVLVEMILIANVAVHGKYLLEYRNSELERTE